MCGYNSFSVIPTEAEGSKDQRRDPSTSLGVTTHKDAAFTLVELAIALMVIGLLIGGVLKGQELIENARVVSYIKQFKDYDTAVMIFRNTYGSLPGDLRNPGTRVPNCTGTCATTLPTHGNGKIDRNDDGGEERGQFWFQLGRAGLLQNVNYDSSGAYVHVTASPPNPYGGHTRIGVTGIIPDFTGHSWQIAMPGTPVNGYVTLQRAIAIDMKMDDGMAKSGIMRTYADMSTPGISNCASPTTNDYNPSLDPTAFCDVFIHSQSM